MSPFVLGSRAHRPGTEIEGTPAAPNPRHAFRWKHIWRSRRRLGLVAAIAAMTAGCGLVPVADRTFEPGVEQLGAGNVHFVADPPKATTSVEVRLRTQDGSPSDVASRFEVGSLIEDTAWSVPGRHGLIVNDRPCDGGFEIEGDRTTEVTIRLRGDLCSVTVTAVQPLATNPTVEGT
jgi:hypothetical protein